MVEEKILAQHLVDCIEARRRYVAALDPSFESDLWQACVSDAEKEVLRVMEASNGLQDIAEVLRRDGSATKALRFMTGPPLSQDQFKLVCHEWPKGTEKTGRPLNEDQAKAVVHAFTVWKDAKRIDGFSTDPGGRLLAEKTALLIAQSEFATRRRMRLAER